VFPSFASDGMRIRSGRPTETDAEIVCVTVAHRRTAGDGVADRYGLCEVTLPS
jgi:hypothetical protein